jgi:hypothetical protein
MKAFAAMVLAALAAVAVPAQVGTGDLLVAPTRVVLEGRQRTAELTLVNTGSETATYRITFVNLRMNEHGGTNEIEAADAVAGERFSESMIRYAPRQVTLEPKAAQTVRLQLRVPAGVEPGEYRSHLLFRAVPAAAPELHPTEAATEFSISLTPIYGISIPVIVRHGETSATVTLSDLELVPATAAAATPNLHFRIGRTGDRSVYGNLTATFVPDRGKATVVGMVNGIAVYTPNASRSAGIALRPPPGFLLEHGRLHLAYTVPEKGNETIAEADLVLR